MENQIYKESNVTYNRFLKDSKNVQSVYKEVKILEEWLGICPFEKFKHTVKQLGYLAETKNKNYEKEFTVWTFYNSRN